MPDPDELRALGERLDDARRRTEQRPQEAPPTSLGVAFRFATELMVAVAVGGGLGWLLDHFLGTRPIFLIVMVLIGAAAGIRNVMRAATELNARAASQAPAVSDDEDEET
jgi:ATP synthase protein I